VQKGKEKASRKCGQGRPARGSKVSLSLDLGGAVQGQRRFSGQYEVA
jgi:hypothetical protein